MPKGHTRRHSAAKSKDTAQSLAIRSSDLPASEKGKRLAKLVQPWMSYEQVHALFGETKAVVYGSFHSAPLTRVVYADYGILVQSGESGGIEAVPQPMSGDGLAVWECNKVFVSTDQQEEQQVFYFHFGFSR